MDLILNLLKGSLTQDEYNGYLKGSAVLHVLNINSRKNNGCAFIARQYLDELMKSGGNIPQESEKQTVPLNKNNKNACESTTKEAARPETTKGTAVLNADEVRQLYIGQNISARECCDIFGVSLSTFVKFLSKNKIEKCPKKNAAVTSHESKTGKAAADERNPTGADLNEQNPELDAAVLAAARNILS